MNIAHILSSFGLGGQERVVVDLASAQKALGHNVRVISLSNTPPRDPEAPIETQLREKGIRALRVPKRDGVDLRLPITLLRLFRCQSIDVVHSHNPLPLFYAASAGRMAGVTVIHTKHGVNRGEPLQIWLRRLGGVLPHAVVAVSEATAKVARQNRECGLSRIRVIPNGIDLTTFTPNTAARASARRELAIPDNAWVFGTVGRVCRDKNHQALVRAAGPMLGPHARLMIVGDGPLLPSLREQCAAFAPWVTLTGMRSDVARLLSAMDAFVLPSLTEGLPLVLLEAMAVGLPIIATTVGGIPEVLQPLSTHSSETRHGGFLVPPGDDTALHQCMLHAITAPSFAREFGSRARARSLQFSATETSNMYIALYNSMRKNQTTKMV